MYALQSLPWCDPLDLAQAVTGDHWALLHSSARTHYSGRYSYLACDLAERIDGQAFGDIARRLGSDQSAFDNAWFGFLSYGLKNELERLPEDAPGQMALPLLCMMRFLQIYVFDHEAKTLTHHSHRPAPALIPYAQDIILPTVLEIGSNMSKAEYLEKAREVIERIHAGDLYQANLTRKFFGRFAGPPDRFSLYKKLCAASAAPFGAYVQLGEYSILSSSPERFLTVSKDGGVTARPIKGSAARMDDTAQDLAARDALAASAKDRAENLMIVDLMRNDLARGCVQGSVRTGALFEVTSHAAIHHMATDIAGQKRDDCSTLELVKQCFPPGSMTGAPKIRAMELCSALEPQARGVYSGALGWFGGDGSCDLSVVIRTLIVEGDRFEFQVGGGIVADSVPEREWEESLDKAMGIARCLGIPRRQLELL